MAAHKGSHTGSFAKGFIDAFLAALKLSDMMEYHRARERYWDAHRFPKDPKGADVRRAFEEGRGSHPGSFGGTSAGAGEDEGMRNHIIQWSNDHGKNPDEALAIWRAESGGGTNMQGDKGADGQPSSFGDFQFHFGGINPAMPHPGMGDDFLKATGIDLRTDNSRESRYKAADFALERASKSGWGDWKTSANKVGVSTTKWADAKPADKPATTTAKASETPPADTAKYGGPNAKTSTGEVVHTDAEGRAIDPKTGKPTQAQVDTPQSNQGVQVASMDDSMGLETFLKQHPEAAGHVTQQNDTDTPIAVPDDSSERSGTPLMPPYPASSTPTGQPPSAPMPPRQGPTIPLPRPNVGMTPSSVPPQQGPPQRTGAPPNVGITPSGIPDRPMMGPPQRTGAPPTVGRTPSSVGDASLDAAPRMPPRTTTPPTAYDPKTIQGPPMRPDDGSRPDLTARSPAVGTPTAADKPAPNAQTVSSSATPRVSQPNTPGFVQFERPNLDQAGGNRGRGGGPSQMTMLDLSHLWGANPPVAQQRAASTPTPAPTSAPQPDYAAGASGNAMSGIARPPDMSDVDFTGAAKGGPIQRVARTGFARGGAIPTRPTLKFAAAGAVPYTSYNPNPPATPMGTFTPGNFSTPGYLPWRGGGDWLVARSGDNPLTMTAGQLQDAYNALPANEQAWYNQQNADAMVGGGGGSGNNWYYNPASLPAAPAPAAPTPAPVPAPAPKPVAPTSTSTTKPVVDTSVTDPSTTTGTGVVGVPNAVTAKSYDPNVDATTGAGFANTSSTGGTNYSVGSNDALQTDANNPNQISGTQILSRKGGPIKRFAKGGIPTRPTMKFAAGGASPAAPSMTGMQYMMQPLSTYVGPLPDGSWNGTPYASLAPNQQTWADSTRNILGGMTSQGHRDAAYWSGGGMNPSGTGNQVDYASQFTPMPSAIWPSAPAAPTPSSQPKPVASSQAQPIIDTTITDPSTTTGAGIPGVPNAVTAKSYNPNVDAATGAGFANTSSTGGTNYSVGPNDALQTDASNPNQISGTQILSRKGGPITRRVRYDDGGGVSPSALGPPPALAGGQQPVPPYYFNPATYAPAGAPVGKGVSMTSAPTYVGGAIPSMPMARGGVVRLADGGDVDPGEAGPMTGGADDEPYDYQGEAIDRQIESDAAAPAKPDQFAAGKDFSGYVTPESIKASGGQDQSTQQGQTSDQPPPGAPPWMGQGKDDQGNPSKGFIAAISGGIHWLAEHLGLTGGAQQNGAIAQDPDTQSNRRNYVAAGAPSLGFDHVAKTKLDDTIDPDRRLDEGMRDILGMEEAYKFLLTQGRETDANRMAASIIQYNVRLSQDFGDQAVKRYMNNDIHGAVDALNKAEKSNPDGRNIWAEVSPDGKTIIAHGTNLNGEELWRRDVAPEAIWAAAKGFKDGTMQYASLEDTAAKYDPGMAKLAAERKAMRKQDDADARVADASKKFGGNQVFTPQSGQAPPTAPTTPPPPLTSASAGQPGGPGVSGPPTSPQTPTPVDTHPVDTAGTAAMPPQPPTADNNMAARGPVTAAGGGGGETATRGGLPNQPGPNVQEAAGEIQFEKIYQALDGEEQTGYQQVEQQVRAQAQPLYLQPPDQSQIVTPEDIKAYNERKDYVDKNNRAVDAQVKELIASKQKDVTATINLKRQRVQAQEAITRQQKIEDDRRTDAATLESNKEKAATTLSDREIEARKTAAGVQQQADKDKEALINYYKNSNPLGPEDLHKLTNPEQYGGKIEDRPDVRMARALGIRVDETTGNIDPDSMKAVFPDGPDEWTMAHNVLNSAIAYTTHGASPSDLATAVAGVIQRKFALEPTQIDTPIGKQTLLMVKDAKGTPILPLLLPPHAVRTLIDLKARSMERYAKMTTEQKAQADAQVKSADLIGSGTNAAVNRPVVMPPGGRLGGTSVPTQQTPSIATPASKPFFGKPVYEGAPAIPPKPEDPYAQPLQ